MELSSTRGMRITSRVQGHSFIIMKYSMSLQSNAPASNSASLLESHTSLHAMNELSSNCIPCISLKASDYESNNSLRSGSVMPMKLEKSQKWIKFKDLKDHSKILVLHLKKEYRTYILKEKDVDVEKAIFGNPCLATFDPQLF